MKGAFGALLAWGVAVAASITVGAHNFGNPPTWNREISRLVYDRCASCHREGGTAFSLMTYQDAQPRATAIKEAVLQRRMPPWGAVKGFGDFKDEQGLTQEQVELVSDWVEGGMRKGNNPNLLPEAPKFDAQRPGAVPPKGLTVSGTTTLSRPLVVWGLLPVRVPKGHSMQMTAVLPDGRVVPLLWLYQYQDRFAHSFVMRAELTLPVGTRIEGVPSTRCSQTSSEFSMTGSALPLLLLIVSVAASGCGKPDAGVPMHVVQTVTAGGIDVVVLSSDEVSKEKDSFTLEFRERGTSNLIDVGAVRIAATMPMAGMAPMFGEVDIERTGVPGRYSVATELGMAGGWQFQIEWTDAAGPHLARVQQAVR